MVKYLKDEPDPDFDPTDLLRSLGSEGSFEVNLDDDLSKEWEAYCQERFMKPLDEAFEEDFSEDLLMLVIGKKSPPEIKGDGDARET